MKANEFVKKFGLLAVREILKSLNSDWYIAQVNIHLEPHEVEFTLDDLKRLVESHELVVSYGGVGKSRLKVQGNRLSYKKTAALWKAILDVESCQ